MNDSNWSKQHYFILFIAVVSLFVSAPLALVLGIVSAQLIGNPFVTMTKPLTSKVLQYSVVGLGFGMNASSAWQAGKEGVLFTIGSLIFVFLISYFFYRLFRLDRIVSYLIASGTAICGGSAIAAVAPIIKAKEEQISVSLAVVFILNALAIILFPWVGKWLELSQHDFGLWSAIAIHDTSSVVGAASKYGNQALEVATTVKLTRALWIIPLSFVTLLFFQVKGTKIKIPWFILFFIFAMLANTFIPAISMISKEIVFIAKLGLKLTLFFIGTGLTKKVISQVGLKPFLFASIIWIFISISSLLVILLV